MAKPKVNYLVKVLSYGNINVYSSSAEKDIGEISQIEGVTSISLGASMDLIFVCTSPRYDTKEIAQEIRDLLTAEVPDIFKGCIDD